LVPFKEKKNISLKPQRVPYAVEDRFKAEIGATDHLKNNVYSNGSFLSRFLNSYKEGPNECREKTKGLKTLGLGAEE
jgi:hypothetical protein